MSTIRIDGSMGEGGGQVLRAALALSMALGKPFRMDNIRANRPKPGLKRQHLACVAAAQVICDAKVSGDVVNSTEIAFTPGRVHPGEYHIDVGSGGSVTLVLQAVIPPLLFAKEPSSITVTGGTHVPFAPTFEFMRDTLFPRLEQLGPKLSATLHRPGFMQIGGGRVTVDIEPGRSGLPFRLEASSPFVGSAALLYSHNIPHDVVVRERDVLLSPRFRDLELREDTIAFTYDGLSGAAPEGTGNAVLITLRTQDGATVFSEIGQRGKAAEAVAAKAASNAVAFLKSGAPVERHLADQLLVPLTLAGGGCFTTEVATPHTRTCLDVLAMFTDIKTEVQQENGRLARIVLK